MNFIRTFCTRRKEYTFANGVRNARDHRIPPTFVALPENIRPLSEDERNARRFQTEQRRERAVLRAEVREAERQRHELELAAAQRFEIQQAAQEICNREIGNLRQEFQAQINRILVHEPPEVQIIAVMPRPKVNSDANGSFCFKNDIFLNISIHLNNFHSIS